VSDGLPNPHAPGASVYPPPGVPYLPCAVCGDLLRFLIRSSDGRAVCRACLAGEVVGARRAWGRR
jgi:hypothetical protein